ncbi:hypothetical protein GQ43DRAFT_352527, partial [Delitschia confertaspora ATCC 74209]
MASIFTYDPDPPRVSSPWATPPAASKLKQSLLRDSKLEPSGPTPTGTHISDPSFGNAGENTITRLEAEPQEGPTEYKLHLLLRRRRSFTRASTARHVSGSLRRTESPSTASSTFPNVSESNLSNTPPPFSATQSRQHRLEQLTTQLLWRLQQSCPYHVSSSTPLILPQLPDECQLAVPSVPQRILPGLEESKGALYEIGVADDGTFVGLADDELEESLNNLRAMAASLGCRVEVLRKVAVGECEWTEHVELSGELKQRVRAGKLWVAEAFVLPDQTLAKNETHGTAQKDSAGLPQIPAALANSSLIADQPKATEQLRVSLTGATMSGKSSLLGSLSTATLDNGRGKSRLSLLKHRHEIESGVTSSVTQELIGYHDLSGQSNDSVSSQVVSYGSGNVTSWLDIHASAEGGRLVFLSDSAGHPRYRRTTVRGLVGWSPHWTLLCVPADSADDPSGRTGIPSSSQENLAPPLADVDLSQAHLQLCLNLELPLVLIITKLDVATKSGIRQTLSRLLSTLKAAGKKPCILPHNPSVVPESQLTTISSSDLTEARKVLGPLRTAPLDTVPILLTSAVKGTGIAKLHAILRELPIPSSAVIPDSPHKTIFHIEDIYGNISALSKPGSHTGSTFGGSTIVGGHLYSGTLAIGDELVLGPYPVDVIPDDSDSGSGKASTPPNRSKRTSPGPIPRSFTGVLHGTTNTSSLLNAGDTLYDRNSEWRRVRITSLRNLRLPVRTLQAGQVGTIGVTPLDLPGATPALVRIRKGMVLVEGDPKANRVISVRFSGSNAEAVKNLSVGSGVVVYVASVRASAKVVSVMPEVDVQDVVKPNHTHPSTRHDDEGHGFGFGFGFDDEEAGQHAGETSPGMSATVVMFQFIASREFVHKAEKVLVLPGGGPGLYGGTERGEKGVAGFDGYVGRVV